MFARFANCPLRPKLPLPKVSVPRLYQKKSGLGSNLHLHYAPVKIAAACRRITQSMMANPVMVGGPGRFDTRLMEVCSGRILAKLGATDRTRAVTIGLQRGIIRL